MESSYFIAQNVDRESNDQDTTTTTTPTISDPNSNNTINALKKNLWKEEEEFRVINQSEPIHIFLKLKPFSKEDLLAKQNQHCYSLQSETTITINPPKSSMYYKNQLQNKQLTNRLFKFSYVFQPEITQKEFFNATVLPCFNKLFDGDNLLIFSYGVTNSGKTYTMQGNNKNPGLIPRTLDLLFNIIKDNFDVKRSYKYKPDKFNEITTLSDNDLQQALNYKEQLLKMCSNFKDFDQTINDAAADMSLVEASKHCFSTESLASIGVNFHVNDADQGVKIQIPSETKYAIWISFYELYNDSIYDLLVSTNKKDDKRPPLKIREDSMRIPYVDGLIQVPVSNTYEAIKILKYGEKNLQKSSNSINVNSSRSHAVFCLKMVTITNDTTMIVNQLSFCDLAGIERSSKTQSNGKTLKEASTINSSLLSLSRCINTLMYNQKNKNNPMQVPYRINKLTRLFQAYFEGHGMIKMIVNINRNANCFDETVNVLKFSSIANKIQINQNDDEKIQYKIEPETVDRSVAWEMDETEDLSNVDEEDEDEEEEEEDEDDDEDMEENEEEEEETTEINEDEEDDDDDHTEVEEPKAKKKITFDSKSKQTINETKESASKIEEDDDDDDEEMEEDDDDEDDDTKRLDESDDDGDDYKSLSKEKLLDVVKKLKTDLKKAHDAAFPYDVRSELVSSWSKRLEETVKSYEGELKDQRAQVEQYYLNKIEWVKQLNEIEYEKKKKEIQTQHEAEIKNLKKEIETCKTRVNDKVEKSIQTDKQINTLEIECNETKRKYSELESTYKKTVQQYNELIEQYKQQTQQNAQLKLDLKQSNVKIEQYKSELKDLANSNAKELAEANQLLKIKLDDIEKLKTLINELEEIKEALDEENMQYDRDVDALKNKILELKKENQLLNKKNEELKNELKQSNQNDNDHMSELSKKTNEINQLKNEIKQFEVLNEKLQLELRESQHLLLQTEKENHVDDIVVKKPPKMKAVSKSAKSSKSSIISNGIIVEDDNEDHQIEEKKMKLMENNLQASTITTSADESLVLVNEVYEQHKTATTTTTTITTAATATRKKSTFNRIAETISKSPLAEYVRNRPSRKPKAATISNAQDKEIIAAAIANDKKSRSAKTSLASKKTSLLESFERLEKHEELEDINEQADADAEVENVVKTKKKRGKKLT